MRVMKAAFSALSVVSMVVVSLSAFGDAIEPPSDQFIIDAMNIHDKVAGYTRKKSEFIGCARGPGTEVYYVCEACDIHLNARQSTYSVIIRSNEFSWYEGKARWVYSRYSEKAKKVYEGKTNWDETVRAAELAHTNKYKGQRGFPPIFLPNDIWAKQIESNEATEILNSLKPVCHGKPPLEFPHTTPAVSTSSSAEDTPKTMDYYDPLVRKYSRMSLAAMAANPDALQLGESLFLNYCTACHGSDARGVRGGIPNLRDNDWLYGGTPEDIELSINYGRSGVMPAWGKVIGSEAGVADVTEYVLGLSGRNVDAAAVARGGETYATYCAACHGADGTGNQAVGAPNLTDNIWLYGGSRVAVMETIAKGRNGRMPLLATVMETKHRRLKNSPPGYGNLLAAYVYSLSTGKVVELK